MKNIFTLISVSVFYFLFEISNTIVSFVDYTCAWVLLEEIDVAAMGANSVLFSSMALLSGLVFVGTEIICSNKIGQGSVKGASNVFSQMMIFGIIAGIVVMILSFVFSDPIVCYMSGFSKDAALLELSKTYFTTLILMIPVSIMTSLMISYNQLNNKGYLIVVYSVVVFIVNTFLDILFCAYYEMGIFGLALATDISMLVGLAVLMISTISKPIIKIIFIFPKLKTVLKVFKYGIPLASRRVLTILVRALINYLLLVAGGSMALAAYSFADIIMYLFSSIGFGISSSVMLLSSYSIGQRDIRNLYSFRRQAKILLTVVSILLFALLWILSDQLIYWSDDYSPQTIAYCIFFIRINAATLLVCNLIEIERNFLQVLNKMFFASLIVFLERLIVLVPILLVLYFKFGVYGVGSAYFFTDIIVLIIILLYEYVFFGINKYIRNKYHDVNIFSTKITKSANIIPSDNILEDFFIEEDIDNKYKRIIMTLIKYNLALISSKKHSDTEIRAYKTRNNIYLTFICSNNHIKFETNPAVLQENKELFSVYSLALQEGMKTNTYNLFGNSIAAYMIPIAKQVPAPKNSST